MIEWRGREEGRKLERRERERGRKNINESELRIQAGRKDRD